MIKKKIIFFIMMSFIPCCASEVMSFADPYSTYQLAADKLIGVLPAQIKCQQGISSHVLAVQLKDIVPKRVENQRLIENILYQDRPMQSEGTALLLLQIAQAESIKSREQESRYTKRLFAFFCLSMATLTVVACNT